MKLDAGEFIRRFLLHALPDGFHRIRHFGFLANGCRRIKLAAIRQTIAAAEACGIGHSRTTEHDATVKHDPEPKQKALDPVICPCCGGTMRVTRLLPRCQPCPDTS